MLNAQSVRAVAEAAEKEILKKNPNLKLDAKALMPKLPSASRGPHQDIANAHVLPVSIGKEIKSPKCGNYQCGNFDTQFSINIFRI